MEILSFIVLVFLSLVGYSGGATGRAGRKADLKPIIIDIILVLLIWAGAVYSRLTYDINKWLLILIWVVAAAILGFLAVNFRRLPSKAKIANKQPKETSSSLLRGLRKGWKEFSQRMGNFQSRVILSLFFLVIVSPFALAVKVLSDPLRIKRSRGDSFWLAKRKAPSELKEYRRQF